VQLLCAVQPGFNVDFASVEALNDKDGKGDYVPRRLDDRICNW